MTHVSCQKALLVTGSRGFLSDSRNFKKLERLNVDRIFLPYYYQFLARIYLTDLEKRQVRSVRYKRIRNHLTGDSEREPRLSVPLLQEDNLSV